MRISTLLKFLVGDRDAIMEVATDRRAIWVGFMFVLSAGLAREYDHESLLHRPWHMLIPLAASVVTSAVLFLVLYAIPKKPESQRPSMFATYRSFLTLFWMTAPLAWLYAIPYERLFSAGDATAANLWTLAFIAGWRVLLMTRIISVVLNIGAVAAFMIVMLLADVLALSTLSMTRLPLINIMGGVSLSQSERLIADVAMSVTMLGFLSLLIWLFGTFAVFCMARADWSFAAQTHTGNSAAPHGRLMRVAIASLLFGVALLPFTQPEQIRRYKVERHLKRGEIAEGLSLMSQAKVSDFPPHWDPPPRVGYGERRPEIVSVAKALAAETSADWVRDIYVQKLDTELRSRISQFGSRQHWSTIAEYAHKQPELEGVSDHWAGLKLLLELGSHLQPEDRVSIQSLIDFAEQSDDTTLDVDQHLPQ